ncbi:DUF2716 domain-containing protein [Enterococcus sp. BWB1-3]|uniref:DUF2716 domain-containing protein n=1 Tax=Enterococcus sp. BWB1-3 TaxID=2787713 RepID=UPI0019232083|nr:DUF2716 domain-containing protein [Enterococcus sp. BWB1-3]MBL1230374.1 DUF2716 domain-containing protein [Enterococcus sp. BWB1-3]
MAKLDEQWIVLPEEDENKIWAKVYESYSFSPNSNTETFKIREPHDVYSCKEAIYKAETDPNWSETLRNIFSQVLGNKPYMFVLDWQHNSFKYDPTNTKEKKNPIFISDESFMGGGYNVYFPSFYPDGDYYLFIAQDFSWGYLTDPQKQQIFVYGETLRKKIEDHKNFLQFIYLNSK